MLLKQLSNMVKKVLEGVQEKFKAFVCYLFFFHQMTALKKL